MSADRSLHNASPETKSRRGCFIVGTDTGVGKTVLTAALAAYCAQRGCAVGVMKPIETGCEADPAACSDGARLRDSAGSRDPLDLISPYRFPAPLAPLAAARQAGKTIHLSSIVAAFETLCVRHRFVLVEGVGGAAVPITEGIDLRDLILALGLPALVVGRSALGGINHAMLTIESLQHRAIPIVGLVLNQPVGIGGTEGERQQDSTVALLRERVTFPVFGPLLFEPALGLKWLEGVSRIAHAPVLGEVAKLIEAIG